MNIQRLSLWFFLPFMMACESSESLEVSQQARSIIIAGMPVHERDYHRTAVELSPKNSSLVQELATAPAIK